jgi:hypothetical protein
MCKKCELSGGTELPQSESKEQIEMRRCLSEVERAMHRASAIAGPNKAMMRAFLGRALGILNAGSAALECEEEKDDRQECDRLLSRLMDEVVRGVARELGDDERIDENDDLYCPFEDQIRLRLATGFQWTESTPREARKVYRARFRFFRPITD